MSDSPARHLAGGRRALLRLGAASIADALAGNALGGGSDIFVRIIEPRLREKLGQNLFIENKPGAGGMVGAAKAMYGSAGSGTSSHLGAVLFGQRIGVPLTHVPYKGTAANLTALLAGEITFCMDNMPLYTPHVKAGTVRLLAVTSANRVPNHPDVPTLQESGIADFDIMSWYGPSAATGTPPAPLGPADYAAFIDAEVRKWAPIIKASGAVVD